MEISQRNRKNVVCSWDQGRCGMSSCWVLMLRTKKRCESTCVGLHTDQAQVTAGKLFPLSVHKLRETLISRKPQETASSSVLEVSHKMKAAMLVDRLFWLEVQGFQMGMVCIPAASEAKQGDPSKSSSEKQNRTEGEGFPPVPRMKSTHEP